MADTFADRYDVPFLNDPQERKRLIEALRARGANPVTHWAQTPNGVWENEPDEPAAGVSADMQLRPGPGVARARNQIVGEGGGIGQGIGPGGAQDDTGKADWEKQVDAVVAQEDALAARRQRQGVISQPEAAMRGTSQGLTLNWGEEIGGLQAASGVPGAGQQTSIPTRPAQLAVRAGTALLGGGRMLLDQLRGTSGDPNSPTAAYDEQVAYDRERNAEAKAQHSRTYTGTEIGAGFALPVPGSTATQIVGGHIVPAFGSRVASSVAQGAIGGAGAGEGGTGKFVGGLIGSGIGAAFPGAQAFLHPTTSRIANAVRNWWNPAGAAERAIGVADRSNAAAIADATRQGQTWARPQVTEAELAAQWAASQGQRVPAGPVIGDVLGAPGGTLARAAANEPSGAARATIENTMIPRKELAGGRIAGEIDQGFNAPSKVRAAQELTAESAQTVSPAYVSVFRHSPDDLSKQAPFFTHISNNSPHVQQAERDAVGALKTDYALQGKVWGGIKNAEYWDAVKKQLDLAHEAAKARPGRDADVIDNARKAILIRMDKLVPGYKQARASAEEIAGERTAGELGSKVAKTHVTDERQRARIAGMQPDQQQQFVNAALTEIRDLAASGKSTEAINRLRRLQQIPGAMTPAEAQEAANIVRRGSGMKMFETDVGGNSTTARQLGAADLISLGGAGLGGYGAYSDRGDRGSTFHGGAALTIGSVANLVARRLPQGTSPIIAQRIAEGLMSQDPRILAEARQALQRMDRWRALRGGGTARVGREAAIAGGAAVGQEQH